LGQLRSKYYNSAPPTPVWSSSTTEFLEQVYIFGIKLCSNIARRVLVGMDLYVLKNRATTDVGERRGGRSMGVALASAALA
jgi:hypothetical protein